MRETLSYENECPVSFPAGFQRLADVEPGQTTTATFLVGVDSILLATQEGDLVQEPGSFTLSFEDGAGAVLTTQLEIDGPRVVVEPFPQA